MTGVRATLGVDVGGTKTEMVLVSDDGSLLHQYRIPTDAAGGPAHVIELVAGAIRSEFAESLPAITAVGIAIAGQVDVEGVVRGAPNLRWTNVPLRSELARRIELPVVVLNDVRAAAWAEWTMGAGRGSQDIVVLFVGTGIGGSVVSGGRMLDGASNVAGELGHMTVEANGRRCHCRNTGCIEAYAGGWAIAERGRDAAAAEPGAAELLVELAGGAERITAGHVADAFHRGDALATRLVQETGSYLGAAAVGLVNGFNPHRLILGGGVIDGLGELVGMTEQVVRARALPAAVDGLEVLPARLANTAPALGAAAMAHAARQGQWGAAATAAFSAPDLRPRT